MALDSDSTEREPGDFNLCAQASACSVALHSDTNGRAGIAPAQFFRRLNSPVDPSIQICKHLRANHLQRLRQLWHPRCSNTPPAGCARSRVSPIQKGFTYVESIS